MYGCGCVNVALSRGLGAWHAAKRAQDCFWAGGAAGGCGQAHPGLTARHIGWATATAPGPQQLPTRGTAWAVQNRDMLWPPPHLPPLPHGGRRAVRMPCGCSRRNPSLSGLCSTCAHEGALQCAIWHACMACAPHQSLPLCCRRHLGRIMCKRSTCGYSLFPPAAVKQQCLSGFLAPAGASACQAQGAAAPSGALGSPQQRR